MKASPISTLVTSTLLCASTLLGACKIPPGLLNPKLGMSPTTGGIPYPSPSPSGDSPDPTNSGSNPSRTCQSNDPDYQCIGLKMVSYEDNQGSTVLSEEEARTLTEELNVVWSPCKIGFQLEQYERAKPVEFGLSMNPNWRSEGSRIRSAFDDKKTMLVVSVGEFAASTIAVTQMPGSGPHGTLVESRYAKNRLTVGHELGHYMGLYHIRNTSNLMNPYIGPKTELLSESQCSIARSTNLRYWTQMMR
jgi:hypothetical protein